MADLRNALHGTSRDDSAAVVVHDGVVTTYTPRNGLVHSRALSEEGVRWADVPTVATPGQAHEAAAAWLADRRGGAGA